MEKKLVLIDGNSIAYRAFYALPLLNNNKGVHTNAIYGFTMMLLRILEQEKPTHLLVAFDAGKTTFRHTTFGEYKGGRQKTPPELSEQFPYIRQLLDTFSVQRYELKNYEADDIIGTLSKQAETDGFEVKVISGDRDMLQLVSDHTTVSITRKGVTEVDDYTPTSLREKYELSPEQIIDMKGLMGDASDNIPGVPGVGEKTAIKLLKSFQTVEGIYEHIDDVSGAKLKEKLVDNKEKAEMSKQLATIEREAPITVTVSDVSVKEYNRDEVAALFKDLGFQTLLEKLGMNDSEATVREERKDIQFEVVTAFQEEQLTAGSIVHVELDGENYLKANLLGIAVVNETGAYVMDGTYVHEDDVLRAFLGNKETEKVTTDVKKVIAYFQRHGMACESFNFDVLLAAYLLNPAEKGKELADLAKEHGYHDVYLDEEVYGKGAKWAVPQKDVLYDHLVRKAYGMKELVNRYESLLRENEQWHLFEDLELPLSRVLAMMEVTGISVNCETLEKMGTELTATLNQLEKQIYELAGDEFNINSPKQLGVILFEKLELPTIKKTKTGYSTSADVLEKLYDKHPIIEQILHYRQLSKLYSTYIKGLLEVVYQEDGKIHTRFNQMLTQTGRLSSVDPNLQNIPIRLEEGRKIRKAFVPSEKDWVIFAADYSQIELRVLAHISKDPNLMDAFLHDMDVHTKTAMDVFGVTKEEVTSDMRRQAKAVNFGIVYGISDFGLAQNLNITRKAAAEFIQRYLDTFEGVKTYMDSIVQEAKLHGYVTTLLNRRRYIPDITSRNFNLRSFAERTAMNTPIQGSAADIIKEAMIRMEQALREKGLRTRMLLQVHDELIFECPQNEIAILETLVPEVMEGAVELCVPLKVDYSYGPTWFDAK